MSECQNELLKWLTCWREIFKATVLVCSEAQLRVRD